MRLHKLNTIAEGIIDVDTVEAVERLVLDDGVPGALQPKDSRRKVADEERRVRLAGGPEVRFDAEMHFQMAFLEPAAAAPSKMRRLRHFGMPSTWL